MERADSQLRADLIRRAVAMGCIGSIGAMFIREATHHLGAVVVFGCISTGAIAIVLELRAVLPSTTTNSPPADIDPDRACNVEGLIRRLVESRADEAEVRSLVRPAQSLQPRR